MKWYRDRSLTEQFPLRYRMYARYSALFGDESTRRVRGGTFLLRVLRSVSHALRLSSITPIKGRDGLVVLADFSDERILDVIHEIRGENKEYDVMCELLTEGDTFVDVGANFGTFSLLASRLVGKNGRVIALEPQPRLVNLLRESIELSGARNCTVLEGACGFAAGDADLYVPGDDSGRAGFFKSFSARRDHALVHVKRLRLDDLLPTLPLSGRTVLKVDVEGSEVDVLNGARELIAARRPALIIELNPWSAAAAGTSPAAVIDAIEAMGYESLATVESFPAIVSRGAIPLGRQLNLVALI